MMREKAESQMVAKYKRR